MYPANASVAAPATVVRAVNAFLIKSPFRLRRSLDEFPIQKEAFDFPAALPAIAQQQQSALLARENIEGKLELTLELYRPSGRGNRPDIVVALPNREFPSRTERITIHRDTNRHRLSALNPMQHQLSIQSPPILAF